MLKIGKSTPFEEDIEKATSENNLSEDWTVILQICDNVINYQDGSKFCLRAIVKRLHHNVPRVVLQTLTLLDACVKNCDRRFLLQVASSEFTTEARKLLGKMHPSAAAKLKELIQKWSLEEFKDDPELCIIPSLYYKLKSEGMEFPSLEKEKKPVPICTDPDAVTSQEEENDIIKAIEISLKDTGRYAPPSEYGGPPNSGPEASSKVLPEPFKVRAIYDFDAAEDNELTIKSGEILFVSDNSNSSWWKGSNHRGEGLFPANFVTEDLDYVPEDLTVEKQSISESVADTSFVGEVKINEEKIETVINWLNDTDPAGDSPDPEDMLRLEDEVYKMGPLIEEQLETIDKRIAMLNMVNEKIMSSFDTFHSLSDNWSTMPATMKYPIKNYPTGTVQLPHQVPSTTAMHPGMQTLPPQHMMFVPVPTAAPQHALATDPRSNAPTTQTQVLNPPQVANMPQPPTESSNSDQSSNVPNPVATSTSQVTHPPMMANPYNQNVGGFYMPQPVPFPFQFPPNQPNMQQPSFIQTSGSTPNFMHIPQYPMPAMGPYVPFPYYYINSASSSPMNPAVTSESQNAESSKISLSAATAELTTVPPVSSYSTYSNDLNAVPLNSVISPDKNENKPELSTNPSVQASGDTHAGSVQVSNQM